MGKNKKENEAKRQERRDAWNKKHAGDKPFCPVEGALTREALNFCLTTDKKVTLEELRMDFGMASRIATGNIPAKSHLHEPVKTIAERLGWKAPTA